MTDIPATLWTLRNALMERVRMETLPIEWAEIAQQLGNYSVALREIERERESGT